MTAPFDFPCRAIIELTPWVQSDLETLKVRLKLRRTGYIVLSHGLKASRLQAIHTGCNGSWVRMIQLYATL